MSSVHKVLAQALEERGLMVDEIPEPWHGLIDAFDEAYRALEADRALLSRSIASGSGESVRDPAEPAQAASQGEADEVHRLTQALRESEARYRIVTEATGELIYDYQPATGRIDWVGAVEAMTGWRPDEFAAIDIARWMELIHPEDRAVAVASLEAALAASAPYYAEYRFRCRDGSYVHIEDRGVFLTEAGFVVRMLGAMKDVTARVEAEQQKRKIEEQLRHAMKMEAIARLAAGVAHDFNNALTTIAGHTGLLLDTIVPGDPLAADVLEIQRAAERAAALTAQLVLFSRTAAADLRVLDLNELVKRSVGVIEHLIGEDVSLELRLAQGVGRVRADAVQLEQAIVNLVANARDAMPRGGRLTVTTSESADDARERNHEAAPGPYAVLEIRDTGCGMDPGTLDHLFEPFFTTKEGGKATGLGLSMVYALMRQLGGFVDVASTSGEGSCFRLYLPTVAEAQKAEGPVMPADMPTGRETVLLVEDDAMVRRLAARLLVHQGYRVIQAGEANEATAEFEAVGGAVDLLLTDVVMPGISGKDLYERLSERKPDLKVLYTSGYQQELVAEHGVLLQGMRLLRKPFTLGQLARAVREAIDGDSNGGLT
jgi:PAS domain S-box-containing protein